MPLHWPALDVVASEWLVIAAGASMRACVLVVAAVLLAAALRRRSAASRSQLWNAIMAATLVLPILPAMMPSLHLGVLPAATALRSLTGMPERSPDRSARVALAEVGSRPAAERARPDPVAATGAGAVEGASAEWRVSWAAILFILWLSGAAVSTAWVALSLARLHRLARQAPPLHDARVISFANRVAGSIGIRGPVRLIEGAPRLVPMTWGLLRARILLPAGWRAWPTGVLHAVLRHELAHVRRRDALGQWLCVAGHVVYWFHPLVWFAGRAARLAREQACDDEAVEQGVDAAEYADALLALARALRHSRPQARAAMALTAHHEFARRIRALTEPDRIRGRPRLLSRAAGWVASAAGAAAIGAVSLADARPLPLQDEVPAHTAAPTRPIVEGAAGHALDTAFARLAAEGLSGTVLVARNGRVIFARGLGLADRTTRRPATVATRYPVAGITKVFTAAAIADLIDRGQLTADVPVSRYLPELRGPAGAVTIHQLLTHTDGLANVTDGGGFADAAEFLRAVEAAEPAFKAGQSYNAVDTGYSLLALIVERVTDQPFENAIRTRLLEPAGMATSTFVDEAATPLDSVATGYPDNDDGRATRLARAGWGTLGSRGLVTTAADLYRWYHAFTHGSLISEAAVLSMTAPYIHTSKRFYQGYGWLLYDSTSVAPYRSVPLQLWRRSGSEPGFEAELVHDRSGDWLAIILLNSDTLLRLRAIAAVRSVMEGVPSVTR